MHIDRYEPIKGRGYVELPQWITRKKAVINIQNQDNLSFPCAYELSISKPNVLREVYNSEI